MKYWLGFEILACGIEIEVNILIMSHSQENILDLIAAHPIHTDTTPFPQLCQLNLMKLLDHQRVFEIFQTQRNC